MKIEQAAAQLDSLGRPTRLEIYQLLARAGSGGMTVGDVQAAVGCAGSTLSHHIKRLVAAGLVTQDRQATTLVCRANDEAVATLAAFLVNECRTDERGPKKPR